MISHPFILAFYGITGMLNRLLSVFHKKATDKNYENNKKIEPKLQDGFIENQSIEESLRYGSGSFSRSGCGTAAIYNAMSSLRIPVPLPEIIRYFEKYGASSFAFFGTAPQSAVRFLRRVGLETKKTASSGRFREVAESSDVLIFTIMNNRKKISGMLHTMCIERKTAPGQGDVFTVHNSHGKAETYRGFDEMMHSLGEGDGKAGGVYMIGLNARKDSSSL